MKNNYIRSLVKRKLPSIRGISKPKTSQSSDKSTLLLHNVITIHTEQVIVLEITLNVT